MSQKEIDNLLRMLEVDPVSLEKKKTATEEDRYICIHCHKVYKIVGERKFPGVKLANGCYLKNVNEIKKKYASDHVKNGHTSNLKKVYKY